MTTVKQKRNKNRLEFFRHQYRWCCRSRLRVLALFDVPEQRPRRSRIAEALNSIAADSVVRATGRSPYGSRLSKISCGRSSLHLGDTCKTPSGWSCDDV
jgi:hypothetical protein